MPPDSVYSYAERLVRVPLSDDNPTLLGLLDGLETLKKSVDDELPLQSFILNVHIGKQVDKLGT